MEAGKTKGRGGGKTYRVSQKRKIEGKDRVGKVEWEMKGEVEGKTQCVENIEKINVVIEES